MFERRLLGYLGSGIVLMLVFASSRAWSAEPYYVDPATAKASPELPQNIVDRLNPQGWLLYTESNGLREAICEIFLAKSVAAQSTTTASGKLKYSMLKQGELIGVVHLLPEATNDYAVDSHHQALKPGYYTMRYSVMPAGTYEHGPVLGEFVVLSLAGMDRDPGQALKSDDLSKLSQSSSSTDLPVSLPLVAPDANVQRFPVVTLDDQGTGVVHLKLPVVTKEASPANELPLAIVMLTPMPNPEGS